MARKPQRSQNRASQRLGRKRPFALQARSPRAAKREPVRRRGGPDEPAEARRQEPGRRG